MLTGRTFPLDVSRHAPLPDRRRVARPGPDGDRRGVPLGRRARHRGRSTASSKRRQGGYGRGKRQTLETDRVIVDSGTYHGVTTGGADHAAADQQRRQARTPEGAGRPAGRPHRPGRRDQLSDRHPPGPRTRQRPRDGLAGGRRRRWPGCCSRELGIEVFGYVRELGGIDAPPPAVVRPGRPRRQPGLHAEPRGRPGDRRGDRRGQGGRRHARRRGRGGRHRLPDRPGQPRPVGPQARRPAGRGGDEHPGDQGGRDRPGRRGGAAARARG